MNTYTFVNTVSVLSLLLLLAACGLQNDNDNNAPEDEISTKTDRPWLLEEEFSADETLHATIFQTVVLRLEGTDKEGSDEGDEAIVKNSIRFVVEKERGHRFCVAEDEQHILRIELIRNGGDTVIKNDRGGACESVTLEQGRYQLNIYHDARGVPVDGKKAFLYRPEGLDMGLSNNSGLPSFNFFAFQSPDGSFASNATAQPAVKWAAIAKAVGINEIWRINPVDAEKRSKFSLVNGRGTELLICRDGGNPIFTGQAHDVNCGRGDNGLAATFKLTGVGLFQYNLDLAVQADGVNPQGPVVTDLNNNLIWNTSGSNTIYTMPYQGYDCPTVCDDTTLPLTSGQIALYQQCDFKGPAFVFTADTSDLSIFNGASAIGLGLGNDTTRSIRLGPDTIGVLYPDVHNGGAALTVGANISCLDATSLGNDTLSSFQIIDQSILNYIISSNGCQNCILTGIDFSNFSLDRGDFTGSVFVGANLSGAAFVDANLTKSNFSGSTTNMSGTNFRGATLTCADYSSANVSTALFEDNLLADDFSCYLDMEDASIDFSFFPTEYWRHTNLAGSTMINVPDTLSTIDAPLDLSGGIYNNITWLVGKKLDGVNLGCYASEVDQITVCPAPNGNKVCSTLQGIDLVGASLKNACLEQAAMEGAFLSASNLDGANLSGVQLKDFKEGNPATLDGAFMRNVNLSGADLTGVSANNVNFYTVAGGTADATGVIATGADFSGSYLAFADFSGSASNLQSTTWTNTMLLGTNFEQTDLSTNTSGGVNSGTATKFTGAYMQGTSFTDANLDNVNFTSTYWDALGSGGSLNFLIPKQNLGFSGYWKVISLPECPLALEYDSGNPPPMNVTNSTNTCPNGGPGPCDNVWGDPLQDISLAFFQSAVPPDFPQDPSASAENQCSSSFSDPNPEDFCWITTNNPSLCSENVLDQ